MTWHGSKRKAIHCMLHSSRLYCYSTEARKYCVFWNWWKTNSQLKYSSPVLILLYPRSHFSSFFLSVSLCKVRPRLQNRVAVLRLYIFNKEDPGSLACLSLFFIQTNLDHFSTPSSCQYMLEWTLHALILLIYSWLNLVVLACVYSSQLSSAAWKHWWWQSRTQSTRHLPSPLLYLALRGGKRRWKLTWRCHWHEVMSLQISPAVTLVLWPRRFERPKAENRWQKGYLNIGST